MIIFDTNVLSEVTKPTPDAGVLHWISSLSHEVATTAITSAELRAGISFLPEGQRKRELERVIDSQLNSFEDLGLVFPFDHEASIEYAIVLQSRKCVGRPISPQDAMIAAICRSKDAVLATRNIKDFEFTGIQLINPWEPAGTSGTTK